jgi:uncharacterized protein (DUF924 family)
MVAHDCDEVLAFWFPQALARDARSLIRQAEWWFRGGADEEIVRRFSPLLERAERGELDDWSHSARTRLALIIVLDQFSRSVYRGSSRAFSNDPKARSLTFKGLEIGHYAALGTTWEKTFFVLPLGHSEQLDERRARREAHRGARSRGVGGPPDLVRVLGQPSPWASRRHRLLWSSPAPEPTSRAAVDP